MTDNLTPEQRKICMSRIKGKETGIEKQIRSEIHQRGYRFRKHVSSLPGKPDIVLPKYGIIIFIHGCFWHGHEGCIKAKLPETRREFWEKKIHGNMERDKENSTTLKKSGWKVITVWQCEINSIVKRGKRVEALIDEIKNCKQ